MKEIGGIPRHLLISTVSIFKNYNEEPPSLTPDRLFEVIAEIYAAPCRNNGTTWNSVALSIERAVGKAAVAFFLPHPRGRNPGNFVAPSYEERLVEQYAQRYAPLNPLSPHVERLAVGSCGFAERCVPEATLERSEFYREWMAPQGLAPGRILGGIIDRDDVGTWAIGICPLRNRRPLGDAELRMARLLLPHLQNALHLTRLIGGLEQRRGALSAALDLSPTGVVLIRMDGSIAATNRAADRIFEADDGLSRGRDGPNAATVDHTQTLRRLIGRSIDIAMGREVHHRGALALPRPSQRRPLQVLLVPLHADTCAFGPGPPVVAMLVTDPEEVSPEPNELFMRLYGLTPSESALARILADGTPLIDAAEKLGITRETARSRLKVLFAKTDTHRQAQLVSLLLHGHWKPVPSEQPAARDPSADG